MEKIELIGFSKTYTDFMSMENGVAKNVFYYKNITQHQFTEANILKKDGCIQY